MSLPALFNGKVTSGADSSRDRACCKSRVVLVLSWLPDSRLVTVMLLTVIWQYHKERTTTTIVAWLHVMLWTLHGTARMAGPLASFPGNCVSNCEGDGCIASSPLEIEFE
jgi:hypothetical protein